MIAETPPQPPTGTDPSVLPSPTEGITQRSVQPLGPEPSTVPPVDGEHLAQPPVFPVASSPSYAGAISIPGYDIHGEIARGGMGAVLRGRDNRLDRELAVKVLLDKRHSDPGLVQRFVAEAKLTGQMEHPGIVPVHELGVYGGGKPFFAMKLVQGDTLAQLLKVRSAPQEDLPRFLKIFEQVCQAVGFAHSQEVIHRDLKPLNIMVGAFGEVQVMDWGLAKRIGFRSQESGVSPDSFGGKTATGADGAEGMGTQAGAVMGTPAYMAPEQARGAVDELDARADVFGLGAVLCEILTGRPPYSGPNSIDVLLRAVEADLADAHGRLALCSADNELIQLAKRCLAVVREDRPADGGAVAAAVAAYQAGVQARLHQEQVARATAETRAEEEAKTLAATEAKLTAERRARRLLVGLAAALLLGVVGTATLAGVAVRQWNAADAARTDAEQQRDKARRQQERAETNFRMARDAVENTVVNVAENEQLKQGNFHELRRKLLVLTTPFYEKFVEQHNEDPELEADRGTAYHRLAFVRAQLGEREQAVADYERMRDIFAKLAASFPAVPRYRLEVIASYNNLGTLLRELGRRREAEAAYRQALALSEQLAAEFPADPEHRRAVGSSQNNLGALWDATRRPEAETAYRQALAIREQLVRDYPTVPAYRQEAARTFNNLGILLRALGRPAEAEAAYRRAAEAFEKLVADAPTESAYRQELARTHNNLGVLLSTQQRMPEAETAFRLSLEIKEKLVADFPTLAGYRLDLAGGLGNLGNLLRHMERWPESAVAYRRAITIQERLTSDFPNIPDYWQSLGQNHCNLGNLLSDSKQLAEAEAAYLAAQAIQEKLAAEFPDMPAYSRDLARTDGNLGNMLENCHKPAAAEAAYRRAVELREKLVKDFPAAPDLRANLASTYLDLGHLFRDCGQVAASLPWYAKAIALLQPHVAKTGAGDAIDRRLLGDARRGRAFALARGGVHADAVAEANALAEAKDVTSDALYELGCVFALASAAVKDDAKLQDQYAARAVELLGQAVAKGCKDIEHLKKDDDLKALRDRDDYKRLLQEWQNNHMP